jgi:hypothetical protein
MGDMEFVVLTTALLYLLLLNILVILCLRGGSKAQTFIPNYRNQTFSTKTSTTLLRKRKPYSHLSKPEWRLEQADSILRELAGEEATDEDFKLFISDLFSKYGFISPQFTDTEIKIRKNIKNLVSLSERSQTILGAFLTEGLKLEEAASITGLSVFQILRGRKQILDVDPNSLVFKVVFFQNDRKFSFPYSVILFSAKKQTTELQKRRSIGSLHGSYIILQRSLERNRVWYFNSTPFRMHGKHTRRTQLLMGGSKRVQRIS